MSNPERIERNPNEARDTIIKSGLSGVAATVLAVTMWSPAGFGGMIGTSVASGLGNESGATPASDALSQLAAYPVPLTPVELQDINNTLAESTSSLEAMRAATDGDIAMIQRLARDPTLGAPQQAVAEMAFPQAAAAPAAMAEAAPAAAPAELRGSFDPSEITAAEVSYTPSYQPPLSDPHLELAELLLSHP